MTESIANINEVITALKNRSVALNQKEKKRKKQCSNIFKIIKRDEKINK